MLAELGRCGRPEPKATGSMCFPFLRGETAVCAPGGFDARSDAVNCETAPACAPPWAWTRRV